MKYLLLFIFCIYSSLSIAQTSEVDELIKKLNWESTIITCNYMLVYKGVDSTGNKLIKIGKEAAPKLLQAINDKTKTIAIHVILNEIFKPENNNLGTVYIYKCEELIGWHYTMTGFHWEWFKESNLSITDEEVAKIRKYWTTYLHTNVLPNQIGDDKMFLALLREDKKNFPCKK